MRSYNQRSINAFLVREFARLPRTGMGRMLDLGCGTRPYLPVYASHFGTCVAGDFERRTAALDVRLDAMALPFASDSFDLVLFSEVVEHIPDAEKAIEEIARVLKPGGVLLITWPFNFMIHEAPHDYVRYTEFGMERVLRSSGMTVEAITYRGGVIALWFNIMEFLVRYGLEAAVRVPGVGWMLRPVRSALCWLLFDLFYSFIFAIGSQRRDERSPAPGQGLRGWRGRLRLWSLGYCFRARKAVP